MQSRQEEVLNNSVTTDEICLYCYDIYHVFKRGVLPSNDAHSLFIQNCESKEFSCKTTNGILIENVIHLRYTPEEKKC